MRTSLRVGAGAFLALVAGLAIMAGLYFAQDRLVIGDLPITRRVSPDHGIALDVSLEQGAEIHPSSTKANIGVQVRSHSRMLACNNFRE